MLNICDSGSCFDGSWLSAHRQAVCNISSLYGKLSCRRTSPQQVDTSVVLSRVRPCLWYGFEYY
ncbi:MAG: hypothetical protein Q7U38_06930, partial [Methylobacter sp.]|nr:hypothetical protein [Methylobacter sp.]